MLKHLSLQNIILVEKVELSFNHGLNILTGETGSGKSAIMHGLSLAIGERADTALIRKGCEKGVIEASFDCHHPFLVDLLMQGGIEHEIGQDLIIRRELIPSGKGRIFINQQLVQLSFLKKIGPYLVNIVGQHASQQLLAVEYHRKILDTFGELSPLLQSFRKCFQHEEDIRKQLEQLIKNEGQRLRDIDLYQRELEELEEAQIKEGEDEALFTEYTYLFNAEEISNKVNEINQALTGDRHSILASLNRQKQLLSELATFDSNLSETLESFQNALIELNEIAHTLRIYQNGQQANPHRLHEVNERLTILNRLKRKYGSNMQEILCYQQEAKEKLFKLENADIEIETLRNALEEAEKKTQSLAEQLSEKRRELAFRLEKELTQELRSLNMSKANLKVRVEPQKRNLEGDDRVEFFISPNFGEHEIPLKESASGGEISRVLLALQTVLADKEEKGTLIFDEIDGNIGGETASIVGEKLQQISKNHQIICITHFPQVATKANFHLQIVKQEKEGRTVTLVRELDEHSRKSELARMAGGVIVK